MTALSGLASAEATLILLKAGFMMAAPAHKKEPNRHRAQSEARRKCEWMRGSEIPRSKISARKANLSFLLLGIGSCVAPRTCQGRAERAQDSLDTINGYNAGRRGRNGLRQRGIQIPLSRFPQGASRGGAVPPTPEARCPPAKSAGTHRCCRLPPQEGCRPLVDPPLSSSVGPGQNRG